MWECIYYLVRILRLMLSTTLQSSFVPLSSNNQTLFVQYINIRTLVFGNTVTVVNCKIKASISCNKMELGFALKTHKAMSNVYQMCLCFLMQKFAFTWMSFVFGHICQWTALSCSARRASCDFRTESNMGVVLGFRTPSWSPSTQLFYKSLKKYIIINTS